MLLLRHYATSDWGCRHRISPIGQIILPRRIGLYGNIMKGTKQTLTVGERESAKVIDYSVYAVHLETTPQAQLPGCCTNTLEARHTVRCV